MVKYNDTVEMKGKAGLVRVRVEDKEAYEANGYELVEGSLVQGQAPNNDGRGNVPLAPAGDDTPDAEGEGDKADDAEAVDLAKASTEQLQAIVKAKDLDVDLSSIKKIGDQRKAVKAALKG
jgi:hypothetical protein